MHRAVKCVIYIALLFSLEQHSQLLATYLSTPQIVPSEAVSSSHVPRITITITITATVTATITERCGGSTTLVATSSTPQATLTPTADRSSVLPSSAAHYSIFTPQIESGATLTATTDGTSAISSSAVDHSIVTPQMESGATLSATADRSFALPSSAAHYLAFTPQLDLDSEATEKAATDNNSMTTSSHELMYSTTTSATSKTSKIQKSFVMHSTVSSHSFKRTSKMQSQGSLSTGVLPSTSISATLNPSTQLTPTLVAASNSIIQGLESASSSSQQNTPEHYPVAQTSHIDTTLDAAITKNAANAGITNKFKTLQSSITKTSSRPPSQSSLLYDQVNIFTSKMHDISTMTSQDAVSAMQITYKSQIEHGNSTVISASMSTTLNLVASAYSNAIDSATFNSGSMTSISSMTSSSPSLTMNLNINSQTASAVEKTSTNSESIISSTLLASVEQLTYKTTAFLGLSSNSKVAKVLSRVSDTSASTPVLNTSFSTALKSTDQLTTSSKVSSISMRAISSNVQDSNSTMPSIQQETTHLGTVALSKSPITTYMSKQTLSIASSSTASSNPASISKRLSTGSSIGTIQAQIRSMTPRTTEPSVSHLQSTVSTSELRFKSLETVSSSSSQSTSAHYPFEQSPHNNTASSIPRTTKYVANTTITNEYPMSQSSIRNNGRSSRFRNLSSSLYAQANLYASMVHDVVTTTSQDSLSTLPITYHLQIQNGSNSVITESTSTTMNSHISAYSKAIESVIVRTLATKSIASLPSATTDVNINSQTVSTPKPTYPSNESMIVSTPPAYAKQYIKTTAFMDVSSTTNVTKVFSRVVQFNTAFASTSEPNVSSSTELESTSQLISLSNVASISMGVVSSYVESLSLPMPSIQRETTRPGTVALSSFETIQAQIRSMTPRTTEPNVSHLQTTESTSKLRFETVSSSSKQSTSAHYPSARTSQNNATSTAATTKDIANATITNKQPMSQSSIESTGESSRYNNRSSSLYRKVNLYTSIIQSASTTTIQDTMSTIQITYQSQIRNDSSSVISTSTTSTTLNSNASAYSNATDSAIFTLGLMTSIVSSALTRTVVNINNQPVFTVKPTSSNNSIIVSTSPASIKQLDSKTTVLMDLSSNSITTKALSRLTQSSAIFKSTPALNVSSSTELGSIGQLISLSKVSSTSIEIISSYVQVSSSPMFSEQYGTTRPSKFASVTSSKSPETSQQVVSKASPSTVSPTLLTSASISRRLSTGSSIKGIQTQVKSMSPGSSKTDVTHIQTTLLTSKSSYLPATITLQNVSSVNSSTTTKTFSQAESTFRPTASSTLSSWIEPKYKNVTLVGQTISQAAIITPSTMSRASASEISASFSSITADLSSEMQQNVSMLENMSQSQSSSSTSQVEYTTPISILKLYLSSLSSSFVSVSSLLQAKISRIDSTTAKKSIGTVQPTAPSLHVSKDSVTSTLAAVKTSSSSILTPMVKITSMPLSSVTPVKLLSNTSSPRSVFSPTAHYTAVTLSSYSTSSSSIADSKSSGTEMVRPSRSLQSHGGTTVASSSKATASSSTPTSLQLVTSAFSQSTSTATSMAKIFSQTGMPTSLLSGSATSSQKHPSVATTMTTSSPGTTSYYSTTLVTTNSTISSKLSSTYEAPSSSVLPTQDPVLSGLVKLYLRVPLPVDINELAFKQQLETNLANTYNVLQVKRRKRAVTREGTTVEVTSLTRTIGDDVQAIFYVKESSTIMPAQHTVAVYNQLTQAALRQRLGANITAASLIVIYQETTRVTTIPTTTASTKVASTTTTIVPTPTPAPVTPVPPVKSELLGMVLQDEANSNNISAGNNRALFETRMADYYRTHKKITGTVVLKIFLLKHEIRSLVYLEFYVTVNNVRQSSSTVAQFYQVNSTISALSALLKMTVIALPYSLVQSTSLANTNKVKMTIKTVHATDMITSNELKTKLSLRLANLYIEAKTVTSKKERWATGSILATIVSLVASTTVQRQGELIFYIMDQGKILNGASVANTLNKVEQSRMSAVLGVEIITLPMAVELLPTKAPTSSNELYWIIGGVTIGVCLLLVLVFAYIIWRRKTGASGKKSVRADRIELPEQHHAGVPKTAAPYAGYGDITRFAQGTTTGGPALKTTSVNVLAKIDEQEVDPKRSSRKKVKSHDSYKPEVGIKIPNSERQHAVYKGCEDDDDSEDAALESEDSIEPSRRAPTRPISGKRPISAAQRPVSAQKEVRVQAGPTRDSNRALAEVQKSAVTSSKSKESEKQKEGDEEEYDNKQEKQKPQKPTAAELPPMGSHVKYIKEVPKSLPLTYPTPINSYTKGSEQFPPLPKTGTSLTGRRLPEIDPELKQKADLERSRNKQRQRLRASGRNFKKPEVEREASLFEKKAWKRAQSDINALLDPIATSNLNNKRARHRRRFRKRQSKVDIAGNTTGCNEDDGENVKLNNYMKVDSTNQSVTSDKTEDASDVNVNEARKRMHTLLDDAFSLLRPTQKMRIPENGEPVFKERLSAGREAPFNQAPLENSLRNPGQAPLALPPPPHGRATAPPLSGVKRRLFNGLIPGDEYGRQTGLYTTPPALTKEPMVVMDRNDQERQRRQLAYPRETFSYDYEQPPSNRNLFITPVQRQPDAMGVLVWSPYKTTTKGENSSNSSAAPLFNTIESPERDRKSLSTSLNSKPYTPHPNYTSIDMRNTPYDTPGLTETPQPLIKAIKEELQRLSQYGRGKAKTKEL
eukprot:gene18141-19951_t